MKPRLCLHGHFYQPPRENPWTGLVPTQRSAWPFRDWNRRILAECYGPISGVPGTGKGRYGTPPTKPPLQSMSFNFGPTLLEWLDRYAPLVSERIHATDQRGMETFNGHGPALAQAYNHLLLPLASKRDKTIQIEWGLRCFRRRFGRDAAGLWLPETALDLETLDIAAGAGVKFVILAPQQIKPISSTQSPAIAAAGPWRCSLPESREIACFCFDDSLFQGLCHGGLAAKHDRLVKAWTELAARQKSGVILGATDGEFFGHHTKPGVRELAMAMAAVRKEGFSFTIPGQVLAEDDWVGPAKIMENTSWSCPHGVTRWQGHCGCRAGGPKTWSQDWKGSLRDALTWLRDEAANLWTIRASEFFAQPEIALIAAVDLFPLFANDDLDKFLGRYGRES